jgi:hypothetical protein
VDWLHELWISIEACLFHNLDVGKFEARLQIFGGMITKREGLRGLLITNIAHFMAS